MSRKNCDADWMLTPLIVAQEIVWSVSTNDKRFWKKIKYKLFELIIFKQLDITWKKV